MAASSSCPSASRLKRLLAGTPSTAEQAQLLRHLDYCPVCQRRLDDLAGANEALLEAARTLPSNAFVKEESLRRVLDEVGGNVNLLTHFCGRDGQIVPPPLPPPPVNLLGPLDDHEVTEVLGQGGMGQVLKAFDRALKRWVAIKVLAPHLANDPVSRLRFAREAQGAAAVRHENVITIHAVRESNGLPYFVMEYVSGGSLQDYLDRGEKADWRIIARLGAEIAAGLAAAHAQALIHRDIKPSNILLQPEDDGRCREPSGTPGCAKIGDFGLVRVAHESRLTETGIIAGTPMYMAPEQVRGEELDARADLFSLGSVLYTLCTGSEPFRGESPIAVIRQVSDATPPPIRAINSSIPAWLAGVVERLHAKRREDRFASAAEVAELLRYNLEHPERPRSVPSPAVQRARRNTIRRRAFLAAIALLCGLLFGLSFYAGWPLHLRTTGLEQPVLTARATLHGHKGPIWSVAFSPDGSLLATGSDDTTLRLWNPANGEQTEVLRGHGGGVFAVAFAHSGKFLLSSDGDGVIRFWDLAKLPLTLPSLPRGEGENRPASPAGEGRVRGQPATLTHHNSNARRVALSPDDRTVAIGNNIQGIELWDVGTLSLRKTVEGQGGSILALAFSPDGRTLAAGDANGNIRLLDANSGREHTSFAADDLGVRSLTFSPDSKTLASTSNRGMDVKLWDMDGHQQSISLTGHDDSLMNLAFSPDGTLLAAGCRKGTVLVWDVHSGQTLATISAHQGAVWSLAFSPDGHTLATVGEDRLGKLWDLRGQQALRP